MKFSSSSPADVRGQMRDRQRRDRALSPELRTRFPQFTTVRLEFDFKDDGPFTPSSQATVFHPPAPAYFVFPCPYSDCSGEFDLSVVVTGMAGDVHDRCKGQLRCTGHRTFDSRVPAPCTLTLDYRVRAMRD